MFSRAILLVTLFTLLSSFMLEAWGAPIVDAASGQLEKRRCMPNCRIDTGESSSVDWSATDTLPTLSLIHPAEATADAASATATSVPAEATASAAETPSTDSPAVDSPAADDLSTSTEAAPSPSTDATTGQVLPFVSDSNSALSAHTSLTGSALALSALAGLALLAL